MDRRTARRCLALAAATGVALGCAGLPTAFSATPARDLQDQRDQVDERIDQATEHLDHSTERVQALADRLRSAERELSAARSHLAAVRGELAAAEALDREMQARLRAAVQRLRAARAELARGRAEVGEQEVELRQLVVAAYEQGDPTLLGLSTVFSSQDPAALAGHLNATSDVVNVETTTLDQLEATKVLLVVKERETEAAKEEVAERRAAAAENLRHMQELERQATQAQADVAQHVERVRKAKADALEAKRADLRALAKLEAERDRIEQLIRDRASRTERRGPVDGAGYLDYPVAGSVTSPYGWRTHPIWGYQALHDGVDFGAGCGTPIRAAADGTVLSAYYQSAWGNRLIVDHGIHRGVGVATISNHLSSYAVGTGQRVTRGQVIGYVGNTGWSTGCHLHFTVLQNGVAVDPMSWF